MAMKIFFVLAAVATLVSCNTSIGLWRDTKATYHWSKRKIEEQNNAAAGGGDQQYEYGAPVY